MPKSVGDTLSDLFNYLAKEGFVQGGHIFYVSYGLRESL